MSGSVVVVESPAKAKTIEKYLGKGYRVLASFGHVRDLVPREGAVDPERGFAMHYEPIGKNEKHVQAIARELKKADTLILATDPDREGEAISWHLCTLLAESGALEHKTVQRVVFHEITQRAIREAMQHPRALAMNLVNAQQARRALDYLVGFNLSPLLWRKVRSGLSAGRVQSPALRLIVEREEAIERFQPQEYWTVTADCAQDQSRFVARLTQLEGTKITQFSLTNEAAARAAEAALRRAAEPGLRVVQVEKKQKRRYPVPPFTTSTLQQEAARKLGFTAQRTMRLAQQLYEGVDVGEGHVGLITYMRTDSTALAQEAVQAIRAHIRATYGHEYLPGQPQEYKTRAKNAQEAHEAIRPTDVGRTPESLKPHLAPELWKLYDLIWKRTVACQMLHATLDTVAVDLAAGPHRLRATGTTIAHPGFLVLYREDVDDPAASEEDEERILPPLREGDWVRLLTVHAEQHFTEPPPRYSEASLVRALEEYGIGRPSTYASILSTLQQREYVTLEKRRFRPTDMGRVVNRFLTTHFAPYVDYHFTAQMEDGLDAISRGEQEWVPLLERFWKPFKQLIGQTDESVSRQQVLQEALAEACPQCGKPLSIRLGKHGRFIGCTGYPDCRYTRDLNGETRQAAPPPQKVEGRTCPRCGSDLLRREGRYGPFIGCSAYPKCRHIEKLAGQEPAGTGVPCPECRQGQMVEKRSRRGKPFYSCSRYPDCQYALWDLPVAQPCPQCAWPLVTRKTLKSGEVLACARKACGWREDQPQERESSGEAAPQPQTTRSAVQTTAQTTARSAAARKTGRKTASQAVAQSPQVAAKSGSRAVRKRAS